MRASTPAALASCLLLAACSDDGLSPVEPGSMLSIVEFRPGTLVEGDTAVIRGLGFSPAADSNAVELDGVPAEVVSATPNELRIVVPDADCRPARAGLVRVHAYELTDSAAVAVRPRALVELAPGQGVYTADGGCLHLGSGGDSAQYIVGALSVTEVVTSVTPVRLAARVAGAGVVAETPAVAPLRRADDVSARDDGSVRFFESPGARGSAPGAAGPSPAASARAAEALRSALTPERVRARRAERAAEARVRDAEARLLERIGGRAGLERARAAAPRGPARAVPAEGDTLDLNVPEFGNGKSACSDAVAVRAVVRRVGSAAVFLEDVENPGDGFTEADFDALDGFLARTTLPVVTSYFGDLTDRDDNDRILVLITKEVNVRENIRGFVFGGDLVSPQQCPASNDAEIFYGFAPDPQGVHGPELDVADVLESYPMLIAHELTHIVQFVNAGAAKTRWELEGGATLAEQLVGFEVYGHGPRQRLGVQELQPGFEDGWYTDWVIDMALYFGWLGGGQRAGGAPEQCSWIEADTDAAEANDGPCENARAAYGVPSMFLRQILDDHGEGYPGGEEALMQAFTSSSSAGLGAFTGVTGESDAFLLVSFAAALSDARFAPEDENTAVHRMPSWNLAQIFAALQDQTTRIGLDPYVSTQASPTLDVEVRAASSAYLHWTPPAGSGHAPTSLRIRAPSGAALPDGMVLWVLRVR